MKTDDVRYIEAGDGVYLHKNDIIRVIQQHIRSYRQLLLMIRDEPDSSLYKGTEGARAALMILVKDVRDNFGY